MDGYRLGNIDIITFDVHTKEQVDKRNKEISKRGMMVIVLSFVTLLFTGTYTTACDSKTEQTKLFMVASMILLGITTVAMVFKIVEETKSTNVNQISDNSEKALNELEKLDWETDKLLLTNSQDGSLVITDNDGIILFHVDKESKGLNGKYSSLTITNKVVSLE